MKYAENAGNENRDSTHDFCSTYLWLVLTVEWLLKPCPSEFPSDYVWELRVTDHSSDKRSRAVRNLHVGVIKDARYGFVRTRAAAGSGRWHGQVVVAVILVKWLVAMRSSECFRAHWGWLTCADFISEAGLCQTQIARA